MNVKLLYQEYIRQGMPPKDAAKIAQQKTGMSVVTGKPIKTQDKLEEGLNEVGYHGQYQQP